MRINEIDKNLWDGFANILQSHIFEHYLFTEDLIRYWFIHYFRGKKKRSKSKPKIEVPYLGTNSKELKLKTNYPISLKLGKNGKNKSRADLFYADEDEVIEFKFNRCTENSKSCTNSNLGSLLNDFNRLSLLDNNNKYAIYICDEYMKKYLFKRHKDNFPFLDFDNKTITDFKYNKEYYNFDGFKDILKHAFSSFLHNKFEDDPTCFDLKRIGYEIKLIYKNKILNSNESKNNYYLFVFEIIS